MRPALVLTLLLIAASLVWFAALIHGSVSLPVADTLTALIGVPLLLRLLARRP